MTAQVTFSCVPEPGCQACMLWQRVCTWPVVAPAIGIRIRAIACRGRAPQKLSANSKRGRMEPGSSASRPTMPARRTAHGLARTVRRAPLLAAGGPGSAATVLGTTGGTPAIAPRVAAGAPARHIAAAAAALGIHPALATAAGNAAAAAACRNHFLNASGAASTCSVGSSLPSRRNFPQGGQVKQRGRQRSWQFAPPPQTQWQPLGCKLRHLSRPLWGLRAGACRRCSRRAVAAPLPRPTAGHHPRPHQSTCRVQGLLSVEMQQRRAVPNRSASAGHPRTALAAYSTMACSVLVKGDSQPTLQTQGLLCSTHGTGSRRLLYLGPSRRGSTRSPSSRHLLSPCPPPRALPRPAPSPGPNAFPAPEPSPPPPPCQRSPRSSPRHPRSCWLQAGLLKLACCFSPCSTGMGQTMLCSSSPGSHSPIQQARLDKNSCNACACHEKHLACPARLPLVQPCRSKRGLAVVCACSPSRCEVRAKHG